MALFQILENSSDCQPFKKKKKFFFLREKKEKRIQKITTEAENHKLSLRGSAMAHSAISQKELQPCASDTQKCTVCLPTIACTLRSSRAVNASHRCPAEMVLCWLGGLGELEAPGGRKQKDTWQCCRVFSMQSTQRALCD